MRLTFRRSARWLLNTTTASPDFRHGWLTSSPTFGGKRTREIRGRGLGGRESRSAAAKGCRTATEARAFRRISRWFVIGAGPKLCLCLRTGCDGTKDNGGRPEQRLTLTRPRLDYHLATLLDDTDTTPREGLSRPGPLLDKQLVDRPARS